MKQNASSTLFKKTCFQPGHIHHEILSHFLQKYQDRRLQQLPLPGTSRFDAVPGDIVVLIYPTLGLYAPKSAHACRVFDVNGNLCIKGFNPEDTKPRPLKVYDHTIVRVINPELEFMHDLFQDDICLLTLPLPLAAIPPSL